MAFGTSESIGSKCTPSLSHIRSLLFELERREQRDNGGDGDELALNSDSPFQVSSKLALVWRLDQRSLGHTNSLSLSHSLSPHPLCTNSVSVLLSSPCLSFVLLHHLLRPLCNTHASGLELASPPIAGSAEVLAFKALCVSPFQPILHLPHSAGHHRHRFPTAAKSKNGRPGLSSIRLTGQFVVVGLRRHADHHRRWQQQPLARGQCGREQR